MVNSESLNQFPIQEGSTTVTRPDNHLFTGARGTYVPKNMSIGDLRRVLIRAAVLADTSGYFNSEFKELVRKDPNYDVDEAIAEACCSRINFNSLITNFCCGLEEVQGVYPNIPNGDESWDPKNPVQYHPV